MTVAEFLDKIKNVLHIKYNPDKKAGVELAENDTVAYVQHVKLTGNFNDNSKFPESIVSADLKGLDTSSVTNMSFMFYNCTSLKNLDVSNFNTSSVTNITSMFYDCGTADTPLKITYDTGWTLGTNNNLGNAHNLDFVLKTN